MRCPPLFPTSSFPPRAPEPPLPHPAGETPRDEYSASPSGPGTDWKAPRQGPPGPREERALEREKEQEDRLLAQQVYARMRVARELWRVRLAALLADLQTEIHRIWQDVMIRRRKTHDEIMEAWHKVLVGS